MRLAVKLTAVTGIMALAAVSPASAQAQDKGSESASAVPAAAFTVDEALAKKGKSLFTARACSGCHTIGKGKMAGPDLAHVHERRSMEWLTSWLKDPTVMLETDPVAKDLLKQYNNMKMPNMKLKDDEITALIHHMAKESQKAKKK